MAIHTRKARRLAWLVCALALFVFLNPALAPRLAQAATSEMAARATPDTAVSSDGRTFDAEVQAGAANMRIGSDTMPSSALSRESNASVPTPELLADLRVQVNPTTAFPYRAVVRISTNFGTCTGWLNGPRTVVTAGHCIHQNGAWASYATIVPGKNGTYNPYGSSSAHRFFSVFGWTRDRNANFDYGAIQLDTPLGSRVGWFGYRWQSASLNNALLTLSGYPTDKNYATQWKQSGKAYDDGALLKYTILTSRGQDGAPVFAPYISGCGVCALAIHTQNVMDEYYGYDKGVRITKSIFNNLTYWRNVSYP